MVMRENIAIIKVFSRFSITFVVKLLAYAIRHPFTAFMALLEATKKPEREDSPPQYDLPLLTSDVEYSRSDDPFLKSTHALSYIDPGIIALANSLGAFKLGKEEYAKKAFEWVRDNIRFGVSSAQSAPEVLEKGRAICFGKMNLYAALCRCAGIPTRYKLSTIGVEENMINFIGSGMEEELGKLYSLLLDAISSIFPHFMLEIKLNDEWIPADPVVPKDFAPVLNYPITMLGDDPNATWAARYDENYYILEDYPFLLELCFKSALKVLRNLCYMVNKQYDDLLPKGREMLEKAGGVEAYNRKFEKTYEKKSKELGSIMEKLMSSPDEL
jgi:hypothetical protein